MADWTEEQQEQRQWKTSNISPFAANIQFILYDCGDSQMVKKKNRIIFHLTLLILMKID